MSPLYLIGAQLFMVSTAMVVFYFNKNSGRRIIYDEQLKRFERRAFIPLLFYFAIILLMFLWQSKATLLAVQKSKVSLPPVVIGSLVGTGIAIPIFVPILIMNFRRVRRRIVALNIPASDIIPAVARALEESGAINVRDRKRWFVHEFTFASGTIKLSSNKMMNRVVFNIQPEERMLEIRDHFIQILRSNFQPLAETAPPFLRFSLRTLVLATVTIGGCMGIYTSTQPWFKVTEWRPHKLECSRIQYSPDGKTLLTQSLAGKPEAGIWDAQTLAKIADLPSGFTCDAVFSKDSKHVALGGSSVSVVVCVAVTGKVENQFAGEQANVLAFSPDGRMLAIGASDNTLKQWNIKAESVEWTVTEPAEITALAYSPDGKGIVSGLSNSDLNFRQASDGKMTSKRGFPSVKWRTLDYSADGNELLSAGDYNFIIYWSSRGDLKGSYYLRDERPSFIQYSTTKGEALVCGYQVQIFELGKYEAKEQFAGYTRGHLSPDGLHLATAGGYDAAIWERRTTEDRWNIAGLPVFWIALVAMIGLAACVWADFKMMKATATASK